MRLDHLQHVTDQPFILFELRDVSLKCRRNRSFGGQDGFGLANEFLPGGGRVESIFRQQILCGSRAARRRATGYSVEMLLVATDLGGGRQKRLLYGRGFLSSSAWPNALPRIPGPRSHP